MHIHIGTRGSARLSAVISVPLYVIPVVDQIRTQHPTSTFSLYSAHTHRHRHIQGVNCKPAIACTNNINKSLVNTCSPNAFTLSFPVSPILSLPVPPLHHLSSHRTNETDDKRFWERFERLNIRLYLNALKWGIFTHNNMHLQFCIAQPLIDDDISKSEHEINVKIFSLSLSLFVSLSFLFARISLDRLEPIKPFLQSIEISINSYSMSIESAIWFNDFQ